MTRPGDDRVRDDPFTGDASAKSPIPTALQGDSLVGIVREICSTPVEPDAMSYDPETIRIVTIRIIDWG